ncbi:hypothetical protein SUDANB178_00083 [Streptomyces sp. enrichment culture]
MRPAPRAGSPISPTGRPSSRAAACRPMGVRLRSLPRPGAGRRSAPGRACVDRTARPCGRRCGPASASTGRLVGVPVTQVRGRNLLDLFDRRDLQHPEHAQHVTAQAVNDPAGFSSRCASRNLRGELGVYRPARCRAPKWVPQWPPECAPQEGWAACPVLVGPVVGRARRTPAGDRWVVIAVAPPLRAAMPAQGAAADRAQGTAAPRSQLRFTDADGMRLTCIELICRGLYAPSVPGQAQANVLDASQGAVDAMKATGHIKVSGDVRPASSANRFEVQD